MKLLEREAVLSELANAWSDAKAGHGRLVLLSGEAGGGKTSVVNHFCAEYLVKATVFMGACDPLGTPTPLGPLIDVATKAGGELERLLQEAKRRDLIFVSCLKLLAGPGRPVVMVIEDVHWADAATLDLLCYLGRRLDASDGLVIATYRDDELPAQHPLRAVLGYLGSSSSVRRLAVEPLSEGAVAHLARGKHRAPSELHRRTGGNPFFVTEVLALAALEVPATARDAIMARVARLSAPARTVLWAAAVTGAPSDERLLIDVSGADRDAVEECVGFGLLCWEARAVRFRHDLTREAVYESIPPARRSELHARVLGDLRAHRGTVDQLGALAYHADEADDAAAVLEFAPAAAAEASKLSAHREAAAQYARAVRFAYGLSASRRAELLERWSAESSVAGQIDDAVGAAEAALELRRSLDDRLATGANLRRLAALLWYTDRKEEAVPTAQAAIALLEDLPADRELAAAYVTLASLHAAAAQSLEVMEYAAKGRRLAETFGATAIIVSALTASASAKLCGPQEDGWPEMLQALDLSLSSDQPGLAERVYVTLLWFGAMHRQFEMCDQHYENAVSYFREHDLALALLRLQESRSVELVHRGRWAEAGDMAEAILAQTYISRVDRIQPLYVLGRLRSRRGDPEVWAPLDEALALSLPRNEIQHVGNVRAVRAEAAWLAGDNARMVAEAEAAYELALACQDPWIVGDLALWLWRGGALVEVPVVLADNPFGLQISGDWRSAAKRWDQLGCPFETATALLDGDDEASLRRALQIFEGLGARPGIAMAAQKLRRLGVRAVPHGPHASTRANPLGLTDRQLQILGLVAEGLTDAEIAERLFLTPKTVAHHVSAVLAKAGVRSRHEAARALTPRT
jgi:DNA-binding CsgD family transcriptional regulator